MAEGGKGGVRRICDAMWESGKKTKKEKQKKTGDASSKRRVTSLIRHVVNTSRHVTKHLAREGVKVLLSFVVISLCTRSCLVFFLFMVNVLFSKVSFHYMGN